MQRCSSHLTLHKNLNWKGPCGLSVHFLGHLVVITNGYLVRNLD